MDRGAAGQRLRSSTRGRLPVPHQDAGEPGGPPAPRGARIVATALEDCTEGRVPLSGVGCNAPSPTCNFLCEGGEVSRSVALTVTSPTRAAGDL